MNKEEPDFIAANDAYKAKFGEAPSIQWLYETCKGDLAKYNALIQKAVTTGVSLGEFEGAPDVLT